MLQTFAMELDSFVSGRGVAYGPHVTALTNHAVAAAAWAQAMNEIMVLIAANPGTLTSVATGIGDRRPARTFP